MRTGLAAAVALVIACGAAPTAAAPSAAAAKESAPASASSAPSPSPIASAAACPPPASASALPDAAKVAPFDAPQFSGFGTLLGIDVEHETVSALLTYSSDKNAGAVERVATIRIVPGERRVAFRAKLLPGTRLSAALLAPAQVLSVEPLQRALPAGVVARIEAVDECGNPTGAVSEVRTTAPAVSGQREVAACFTLTPSSPTVFPIGSRVTFFGGPVTASSLHDLQSMPLEGRFPTRGDRITAMVFVKTGSEYTVSDQTFTGAVSGTQQTLHGVVFFEDAH